MPITLVDRAAENKSSTRLTYYARETYARAKRERCLS